MCNCGKQNDVEKKDFKKKQIEEQIKKRKDRINNIYQKKFF